MDKVAQLKEDLEIIAEINKDLEMLEKEQLEQIGKILRRLEVLHKESTPFRVGRFSHLLCVCVCVCVRVRVCMCVCV